MSRDACLLVVGAGRVGLSLAGDLATAGTFGPVTVIGRAPEPPAFLAGHPAVAYRSFQAGAPGAASEVADLLSEPPAGAPDRPSEPGAPAERVLVFCVPDDALTAVAEGWADALGSGPAPRAAPEVVLHTSGRQPSSVLAPFRPLGAATGAWHPLLALASPRTGAFRGIAVGIEGEARARDTARRLAAAVDAHVLAVREDRKERYHAAAVFASNHLVACLSVASRELRAACGEDAGIADLLPLARSALGGLERGLAEGATGPIVRGDVETVRAHLAALDPGTAALYRALAAELLELVEARLPESVRRQLEELVARPSEDSGPAR